MGGLRPRGGPVLRSGTSPLPSPSPTHCWRVPTRSVFFWGSGVAGEWLPLQQRVRIPRMLSRGARGRECPLGLPCQTNQGDRSPDGSLRSKKATAMPPRNSGNATSRPSFAWRVSDSAVRARPWPTRRMRRSALSTAFAAALRNRYPRLDDRDDLWRLLVVITERKAIDQARRQGRLKRGGRRILGTSEFAECDLVGSGIARVRCTGADPRVRRAGGRRVSEPARTAPR